MPARNVKVKRRRLRFERRNLSSRLSQQPTPSNYNWQTLLKGVNMEKVIASFFGILLLCGLVGGGCVYVPKYNVYSQQMDGKAKLAEAESSRQIAVLEAHAKMESATQLAQAEVIRAQGAAQANHILQNSLGGPEGYLRYLQIQAYQDSNAKLIYVPTEGGLPVLEASRLPQQQ
jgi:hypothetical protein